MNIEDAHCEEGSLSDYGAGSFSGLGRKSSQLVKLCYLRERL